MALDKKYLKWDEILKPGNPVYIIYFSTKDKYITCPTCNGLSEVVINDEKFPCPNNKCFSGQIREIVPAKWYVDGPQVITRVNIELANKRKDYLSGKEKLEDSDKYRVLYWFDGNGFHPEVVFPTKNLATRAVNKLNEAILAEDLYQENKKGN